MRTIHITESQLNALKKALMEQNNTYTIDLTKELEKHDGQIKNAITDVTASNPSLSNDMKNGRALVGANPESITSESTNKFFTKRQIKEAKVNNKKRNSVVYRKKDIK